MTAYLTPAEFKSYSTMPSEWIDALQAAAPGWLAAQLELASQWINTRLTKRYAAPFESPAPVAVLGWVGAMVTLRAYLRRGVDAQDPQFIEIKAAAQLAVDEVKEAADSVDGLFDLPLRQDTVASGISKGGPYSYSETSPYVGYDVQSRVGRNEDESGGGTFG